MEVDEMIEQYEENLRKAEKDIEASLRAICSLRGEDFPRYELNTALGIIQNAIGETYRFYNNPDIEVQ